MRRKILLILGIIVLFAVTFVVAVFLTLPTDSIRHLAEKSIEKQLKYKQGIEIEKLTVTPMLNIRAENFQMRSREVEESADNLAVREGVFNGFLCAPLVETMPFTIEEIFVNPKIFQTIGGKPEGSFSLKLIEGMIEGSVKGIGKNIEIKAEGSDIALNVFTLLSNITKMQIYGSLGFDLRAVLNKSKLVEFKVNLDSANTAMCPKRIKLDVPGLPFIELPFISFGNIKADLEISKNKLIINHLVSDGPDIKLDVKGNVTLKSDDNPVPRLNIDATITPSEQWVKDNDMKVIYQMCEKLEDGSIQLSLTGTTKRLKHDCGTPIPEPVEETAEGDEKAEENVDGGKAEDNADAEKDDKKDKKNKKEKADKKKNLKKEAKAEKKNKK